MIYILERGPTPPNSKSCFFYKFIFCKADNNVGSILAKLASKVAYEAHLLVIVRSGKALMNEVYVKEVR